MNRPAVHWHEGMFLRPHQFQAAEHHADQLTFAMPGAISLTTGGLRKLQIDQDALAAHRFVVRELEIRFRDGTIVTLPDDASELALDLQEAFEDGREADIYLAIPQYRPRQPNLETLSYRACPATAATRSIWKTRTRAPTRSPSPSVGSTSNSNTAARNSPGFEILQLARLEKSDRAEAVPQLANSYFPPVLNCDAC